MRRSAAEHHGSSDGRAVDRRALGQLTALVATGLVCTILIFGFMIFAALQAVWIIDEVSSDRERLQVGRAIAAAPGGINEITLDAIAATLDLDDARLTTADGVRPDELAAPVFPASRDVVAWTPHRFGTFIFHTVAPLRILLGSLFVIVVATIGIRVHILGRRLDRRRADAAQLALTDGLTGLGNRLAFDEGLKSRSEAAAAGGPDFSVLLIDLDGFKGINDGFGHAAGDLVLKTVATHLRGCGRPDDLVARIGGDEFAVLRASDDFEDFIGTFRHRMSSPLQLGGQSIRLAASIGAARSDDFSGDASRLTQAADAALYRAKRSGPGNAELAVPHRLDSRYAA